MDRRLWSRTKGIEHLFVCEQVNWLLSKLWLETKRRRTYRSPVTELWLISDSSAVGASCRAACSDFPEKKTKRKNILENLIYIIKYFPSVPASREMFWYTTIALFAYYPSCIFCKIRICIFSVLSLKRCHMVYPIISDGFLKCASIIGLLPLV